MDPMFDKAVIDRVERCVKRDKNAPCILIWSLGNESGYGNSFEKAGRWVKAYDPTRLTHYEGAVYEAEGHVNDTSMIDLYSRMYPHVEWIDEYFADPGNKKPYFMCEFVHAMGNGPGGIRAYMDRMYRYEGFLGGCVWEWCDHAIYDGVAENGKERYLYGGDHGERFHDGNFCVDGLLYPDRTPHTGLREWKNAICPVFVTEIDAANGMFLVENRFDFLEASGEAELCYEIKAGGSAQDETVILADGTKALADGSGTLTTGITTYTDGVAKLSENSSALTDGTKKLSTGAKTLSSGATTLANGTKTLANGTSTLLSGTEKLVSNNSTLNNGAKQLADGAAQIQSGSSQLYDGSKKLGSGMKELKDGSKTLTTSLSDGATTVKDNSASDETIKMFATPVVSDETKLTDVPNNGHAMAPYMMSVGLWVGALAFCLMYPLAQYKGKLKSGFAWWASKASVLYPVAILQGICLILLLRAFNGFTPAEMGKTVLFACLTSMTFTSIMYFFNITLGKVGSFLMLVFMVVQLAGSAGTYPVEVSPSFVAKIHAYVPFTYTVDAFRATISGGRSITTSIIVMVALLVIFTILTILQFNHMTKRKKAEKVVLFDWLEERGLA